MNSDSRSLSEVSAILQYATKAAMLKGFDGELFIRFVERIHVYSRTEIGFELKCGITLKERPVIWMEHIPYGYRIENGRAVLDEQKKRIADMDEFLRERLTA